MRGYGLPLTPAELFQRALHALDALDAQVRKQHGNAFGALSEDQQEVSLVDAATQADEAALEAYRPGLGSDTTLVDSANALVRAQTAHEDALAAMRIASAALAFAAGTMGEAEASP